MDFLKGMLTPKTFNRLGFVVVICWITLGVTLFGIFVNMENGESSEFRCDVETRDKEVIREKCFEQYEKRCNPLGFPVYAFVIVNFSVIAIVCVIYSQTVKSRVSELEDCDTDVETGGVNTRRRLFIAYCCQLATRFAMGILFIVLQTQVLYPRSFPSHYQCNLQKPTSTEGNFTNSSGNNFTSTQTYDCHQQAAKKTFWTRSLIVVDGIFALTVLIEVICIFSRARKGKIFMEDLQFLADHLNNGPAPRNEEMRQAIQENEEPPELPLKSTRQGTLSSLDLCGGNIADGGVMHLCEALTHKNCKLSKLNLYSNCVTDAGVTFLTEALTHINCKISTLNLSNNVITDTGVGRLCEALTHSDCKLGELNLYGNFITDAGVMFLTDAITHIHCKLRILNLAGNRITDAGVRDLSKALTQNDCKLTELNLSSNFIRDVGVMFITEAITHINCKLSSLNLSDNSITKSGAMHLSKALTHMNCKIKNLNLSGNNITDVGVMQLTEAISCSHCKLNILDLSVNSITDEGVLHLSIALTQKSCKLSYLDLYGNRITDASVVHLAESLTHSNCQLSELNLGGNSITNSGVVSLCQRLARSNCKFRA